MHIGLYFGSFNPIHIGHLIIASHIIEYTNINEVWFVVSPQNPLKSPIELLDENNRLQLVKIAIESDDRFKLCDVEFHLSKPSYTIHTLNYLSQQYSQYTFSVIMGSDTYVDLPKWKNFQQLIKEYQIIVYPRKDIVLNEPLFENTTIANAPILDISSTYVRQNVQQNKNIRYIVPDKVIQEIEKQGYYKK